MRIYHVYSVSCAQQGTGETWHGFETAMNTSEAKDQFYRNVFAKDAKRYKPHKPSGLDLVWHLHEITRFNVPDFEQPVRAGGVDEWGTTDVGGVVPDVSD